MRKIAWETLHCTARLDGLSARRHCPRAARASRGTRHLGLRWLDPARTGDRTVYDIRIGASPRRGARVHRGRACRRQARRHRRGGHHPPRTNTVLHRATVSRQRLEPRLCLEPRATHRTVQALVCGSTATCTTASISPLARHASLPTRRGSTPPRIQTTTLRCASSCEPFRFLVRGHERRCQCRPYDQFCVVLGTSAPRSTSSRSVTVTVLPFDFTSHQNATSSSSFEALLSSRSRPVHHTSRKRRASVSLWPQRALGALRLGFGDPCFKRHRPPEHRGSRFSHPLRPSSHVPAFICGRNLSSRLEVEPHRVSSEKGLSASRRGFRHPGHE